MMYRTLRIALIAAAVAFAGQALAAKSKPAAAPAAAGKPQPTQLGQFGDWSAFQVGNAKGRSCFTISNPKERKPDKTVYQLAVQGLKQAAKSVGSVAPTILGIIEGVIGIVQALSGV